MKVGAVKALVMAKVRALFSSNDPYNQFYIKNVEHVLQSCFGHAKDTDEFIYRWKDDVIAKFIGTLQLPIQSNNQPRVPQDKFDAVVDICKQSCQAQGQDEKQSAVVSRGQFFQRKGNPNLPKFAINKTIGEPYLVNDKNYYVPYRHTFPKSIGYVHYNKFDITKIADVKSPSVNVITDKDSQNVAQEHVSRGFKPLVMNACNAYDICGAFEDGYGTQEESLAFTTSLSRSLYLLRDDSKDKRKHYRNPLQHDEKSPHNAVYSKDVVCFALARDVKDTLNHQYALVPPFEFDVFSIPAFDLRDPARHKHSDQSRFIKGNAFNMGLFKEAMEKKIRLFFMTALQEGNTSIVAAALGCGAFKHPSYPSETLEAVVSAYVKVCKEFYPKFQRIDIVALDREFAEVLTKKLAEENVNAAAKSNNSSGCSLQ